MLSYILLLLAAAKHSIAIASSRPNIVLFMPDEWRFDWADQHFISDLQLNTPTFSKFVEKGTRFVNAVVNAPLCAPSRACLASGKEYDYTDVPDNFHDFPTETDTFYKLMHKNGYWVMMSGKDDLTKWTGVGMEGKYRMDELGFDDQARTMEKREILRHYPDVMDPYGTYLLEHYNTVKDEEQTEWEITDKCISHCCLKKYEGQHVCSKTLNVHTMAYHDNWITRKTVQMMDNIPTDDDTPWFLQVNWASPHPPFILLDSMNDTVKDRDLPLPMGTKMKSKVKAEMLDSRRQYVAMIENLDTEMQTVIDKVKDMGVYDDTIFCITSDHGEMLGDFGVFGKAAPWVASTNVPLVCMGKDIQENVVLDTYVSFIDLAGTFLDYSDTDYDDTSMTTQSLKSFLNGDWSDSENDYQRDYIVSGLYEWRLVIEEIDDDTIWKYICCKTKCPHRHFTVSNDGYVHLLFNIANDNYEITNLADDYPHIVKKMRNYLPNGFYDDSSTKSSFLRFTTALL